MNPSPIAYLHWAKTHLRGESACDLASSGFPSREIESLDLDAESLQLTAPNAYGWAPLRDSIGEHYGLSGSEIVITAGASMANFLAVMALQTPGETVLVEHPVYEPMRRLPTLFGGKVTPLLRKMNEGWSISAAHLEEQLKATGAKGVFLSNPHNPSGVMLSDVTLTELAETCDRFGAWMIVDEVYAEFHSRKPDALQEWVKRGTVVILSSMTKVYGFGPVRIGWIAASPSRATHLLDLTQYTYAVHGAINERIGLAVWNQRHQFREEAVRRAEFNLGILRNFMDSAPQLSWVDPGNGILGFIRVDGMEDTRVLADRLQAEFGVTVVPGHFFGDPTCFRVGLGQPSGVVRTGLSSLRKVLLSF